MEFEHNGCHNHDALFLCFFLPIIKIGTVCFGMLDSLFPYFTVMTLNLEEEQDRLQTFFGLNFVKKINFEMNDNNLMLYKVLELRT